MLTLLVALAAGIGAVARYVVDRSVQRRMTGPFPFGTLTINVSGSLLLGVTSGLATHHGLSGGAAAVLGSGFAGGYTTLSAWAWETVTLAGLRAWWLAGANVVGSFAAGLAAAAAGLGLGRLW